MVTDKLIISSLLLFLLVIYLEKLFFCVKFWSEIFHLTFDSSIICCPLADEPIAMVLVTWWRLESLRRVLLHHLGVVEVYLVLLQGNINIMFRWQVFLGRPRWSQIWSWVNVLIKLHEMCFHRGLRVELVQRIVKRSHGAYLLLDDIIIFFIPFAGQIFILMDTFFRNMATIC
jgi:hypothetical protein